MKIDIGYSQEEVEVLGVEKSQEFGLAKHAQEMIFTMFTKNIYSNPIGSVVREITSNCFDSHTEAGIKDAVFVKLTKENGDHYISFIDNGVGMSRERITKVYAQYFNSTKSNSNNQIGGFGIGGKTPLAYAESFFLITRYEGTKYTYSIRKGTKSPVLDLLTKESTDERNGTTVKIPVKSSDVQTFEREIVRQLYYFENVIFEGFSYVKNDYKIIEGKHFFYRGTDYNPYVHICLGRVAYPIDYQVFNDGDLDMSEWNVPIAIKLDIGDINVTVSREAIDYTPETKKLIKKKMLLAKEEMIGMLQKQHEKINTLEEYYVVEDSYSNLIMPGGHTLNVHSFLRKGNLYSKPIFKKLNELNIPSQSEIIHHFYDVSMFGKKGKRDRTWDKSVKTVGNEHVYFLTDDEDMPRKKNAYMKYMYKHFYGIRRAEFSISLVKALVAKLTPKNSVASSKVIFAQFRELQKEVQALVEGKAKKYASITVPAGFTVTKTSNPNHEMSMTKCGRYTYKEKYKLSDIEDSNVTFYYGSTEDEGELREMGHIYERLFNPKRTKKFAVGGEYEGEPLRFVMIAKSNLRYVTDVKNMKPFAEAKKMFLRKRDKVMGMLEMRKFVARYNELNSLFLNKHIFASVDSEYAKVLVELNKIRVMYDKMDRYEINIGDDSPVLKLLGIDAQKITFKGEKLIKIVEETSAKNGMLQYVRIDEDFDPRDNAYSKKEISDIMQLLRLAYVK
jgi:hypothetical protein